jgi:hypothetical protein
MTNDCMGRFNKKNYGDGMSGVGVRLIHLGA